MALKGNRDSIYEDVSFFSSGTFEKGSFVTVVTPGSGAALDQAANVCAVQNASGKVPIGCSLTDVVNLDLTRTHVNFLKDEVQTGSKVCVLKKGWVTTNMVSGTPSGYEPAYLTNSGKVTPTFVNSTATPLVGRFMSTLDEDSYCKVEVNLP